jgi:hypothetical protein
MEKDIYYILKTKSDLILYKSSIQDFIDDLGNLPIHFKIQS